MGHQVNLNTVMTIFIPVSCSPVTRYKSIVKVLGGISGVSAKMILGRQCYPCQSMGL